MHSSVPATSFRDSRLSRRDRLVSAAVSLVLCLLLAVMLVNMGAFGPAGNKRGPNLVAVDIRPQAAAKAPQRARAAHSAASPAIAPVPIPVPLPTETPVPPFKLIPLTRDELASADIGRMPKRGPAAGSQGAAADNGTDGVSGGGPGGTQLYNAEWYREPTHAELAGYMSGKVARRGDWAMIACRTIDHYHVEDCREMSESPPGSGLARALRQAAWQFLVRPPRVGGKAMVGSWVRIRFDFSQAPERDGTGGVQQ